LILKAGCDENEEEIIESTLRQITQWHSISSVGAFVLQTSSGDCPLATCTAAFARAGPY